MHQNHIVPETLLARVSGTAHFLHEEEMDRHECLSKKLSDTSAGFGNPKVTLWAA